MEDLALSSVEIRLLSNQLVKWKKVRYIYDGVSSDLFAAYYGTSRCHQIMEILGWVEHSSKEIAEEFQRRYGSECLDTQERYED